MSYDDLRDPPVLSFHEVGSDGSISLASANVPYEELDWTRRLSTCGEFTAVLACELPVSWPGRYLVTASGEDEVGIIEKVEATEDADGDSCTVSGRFAESLWDRYGISYGGETVRGADWRQAVTAACASWHMDDAPPIALGDGTDGTRTGTSYVLAGESDSTAMEAIYTATEDNGARPLLSYDRDAAPGTLTLSLVEGLDRTRSQSENALCILSLGMGDADSVDYSGDYSTACSEVVAYVTETDDDDNEVTTAVTVERSGFDAGTMWAQRAYEDVSSLVDDDDVTTASVRSAGELRALDHEESLSIDCSVIGSGYREDWDLGDVVEVEMPSLSLTASEHIEEVDETWGTDGLSLTVTVGTKELSKIARALIGRR